MLIYELHGRLAETYETERRAHLETVDLLRRIRAGEVDIEAVTVTEGNAWFIVEKHQEAAE